MAKLLLFLVGIIQICAGIKTAQKLTLDAPDAADFKETSWTLESLAGELKTMKEHLILDLKSRLYELEKKNLHEQGKGEAQLKKMREQENIMHIQSSEIHALKSRLQTLESKLGTKPENKLATFQNPGLYLYTGFACDTGNVTLSCTGEKTIIVTSAYYGQYIQTCAEDCCPPHPEDCLESLEVHAPGDWVALKLMCDNETNCMFENPGRNVPTCVEPYISDYIIVYYSCVPEDTSEPVAFTAYTLTQRLYNDGDVVVFDLTETNVGNHFQTTTSHFLCPFSGLYLFYTSMQSVTDHVLHCHIMKEQQILATFWDSGAHGHQGSNMAITECSQGERIWIQVGGDNRGVRATEEDRYPTFSGLLLYVL